MVGIQAVQHRALSAVSPRCLPCIQEVLDKRPPRLHVIYLSPLAAPRLLSTFLPQDLCMVSPCLAHTVPLSSLLSSLGAHPLSEHFTSLGPHDPSHSRCVPLLSLCGRKPEVLPRCLYASSLTKSTEQRSTTALVDRPFKS